MIKIETVKKVTTFVVSLGVGTIIDNAVKSTTPDSIGTIKKVLIGVGAFALGGMVSLAVSKHADNMIDEMVAVVKKMVTEEKV